MGGETGQIVRKSTDQSFQTPIIDKIVPTHSTSRDVLVQTPSTIVEKKPGEKSNEGLEYRGGSRPFYYEPGQFFTENKSINFLLDASASVGVKQGSNGEPSEIQNEQAAIHGLESIIGSDTKVSYSFLGVVQKDLGDAREFLKNTKGAITLNNKSVEVIGADGKWKTCVNIPDGEIVKAVESSEFFKSDDKYYKVENSRLFLIEKMDVPHYNQENHSFNSGYAPLSGNDVEYSKLVKVFDGIVGAGRDLMGGTPFFASLNEVPVSKGETYILTDMAKYSNYKLFDFKPRAAWDGSISGKGEDGLDYSIKLSAAERSSLKSKGVVQHGDYKIEANSTGSFSVSYFSPNSGDQINARGHGIGGIQEYAQGNANEEKTQQNAVASIISRFKSAENSISIFNIGSTGDGGYLREISEKTGGKFQNCTFDDLSEVMTATMSEARQTVSLNTGENLELKVIPLDQYEKLSSTVRYPENSTGEVILPAGAEVKYVKGETIGYMQKLENAYIRLDFSGSTTASGSLGQIKSTSSILAKKGYDVQPMAGYGSTSNILPYDLAKEYQNAAIEWGKEHPASSIRAASWVTSLINLKATPESLVAPGSPQAAKIPKIAGFTKEETIGLAVYSQLALEERMDQWPSIAVSYNLKLPEDFKIEPYMDMIGWRKYGEKVERASGNKNSNFTKYLQGGAAGKYPIDSRFKDQDHILVQIKDYIENGSPGIPLVIFTDKADPASSFVNQTSTTKEKLYTQKGSVEIETSTTKPIATKDSWDQSDNLLPSGWRDQMKQQDKSVLFFTYKRPSEYPSSENIENTINAGAQAGLMREIPTKASNVQQTMEDFISRSKPTVYTNVDICYTLNGETKHIKASIPDGASLSIKTATTN